MTERRAGRQVPIAAKHSSNILPLTGIDAALCFEDLALTGRRLAALMLARLQGADEAHLTELQPTQWAGDDT